MARTEGEAGLTVSRVTWDSSDEGRRFRQISTNWEANLSPQAIIDTVLLRQSEQRFHKDLHMMINQEGQRRKGSSSTQK